jgi:hypothetical protein
MPLFSRKNIPSNNLPAPWLTSESQFSQQPPVCTWSAHAPQSGPSPSPFPRYSHTLTPTGAGELLLFGGYVHGADSDLYVFSTQDFSTTLIQTNGEAPIPRYSHGAALIDSTLLICGGKTNAGQGVLNHNSLDLLNLGTSCPSMSSPIPADDSLRSRTAKVDPRRSQWSRSGRSSRPYVNRGRFQAFRLRWSDWQKNF